MHGILKCIYQPIRDILEVNSTEQLPDFDKYDS